MIITQLYGGLGNQMFQYAAGRRIAYLHKTILKLDISAFKDSPEREYSLHSFNIEEKFASEEEIKYFRLDKRNKFYTFLYNIFPFFKASNFIKEENFNFDKSILTLGNNIYLDGYWQSPKYFEDIETVIRKDFTLKSEIDSKLKPILREIETTHSIGIHFRRGDYVTNKKVNTYHGVCDMNYYRKAISIIGSKISKPKLFIFSDDISWVKKNFHPEFEMSFISSTDNKAYEDLHLMSKCKHTIIANSTFSWWSAYLNENKNKIIVGPKKWFNDPSVDASDLLLSSWFAL